MRRIFYLTLVNSIAFIIGSQTAHVWINPMKDYKDFILKAEADYQVHQQELRDVEDYLEKKRQQRVKQIS
jgi:C4-dicarboxylate transporter